MRRKSGKVIVQGKCGRNEGGFKGGERRENELGASLLLLRH